MTRINKLVAVFAFALMAMVLPSVASAQYNGGYGYPNGYPNGGYGYPNGRYGRDIKGNIDSLYNQAKDFERTVDHGNSRYNDRSFRQLVDQFVDATKDLRNNYGRGRDLGNSSDEAQRVLSLASEIDSQIGYNNGYGNGGYRNDRYGNRGGYGNGYGLQGQWNQMRGNLQVISDTYGYGGYNNRGNRNNGTWRNRLPFPLPF